MKMKARFQVLALVLAAGTFGFYGCSEDSNPFDPVAANGDRAATGTLPTVSGGTAQGEIDTTDDIQIEFDQFMRKDLLETAGNVSVLDVTAGTEVSGSPAGEQVLSVVYETETRRLYIRPSGGAFPSDAAFLVTIKNAVTNMTGQPLDGDKDTRAEGTPYDDYRARFYTGSGLEVWAAIRTAPPTITSTTPSRFGFLGAIPVDQTFTVTFTAGIDTTTLAASSFALVETASGTEIPLEQAAAPTATSVTLRPQGAAPLDNGKGYTFRVKPGVIKAVVDTTGNAASPLLNLDVDGDGVEPTEDPLEINFLTVAAPGDDATPPMVLGFSDPGPTDEWVKVYFSEAMDVATLTPQNIRLIWMADGSLIRGRIIPDADSTAFRFTLENATPRSPFFYRIEVSRQVTDAQGWPLDQNENGLGGEIAHGGTPGDDFLDGYFRY